MWSGRCQRRAPQSCPGCGVAPWVFKFFELVFVLLPIQRTGIDGVALQRLGTRKGTAEGLLQYRVGRLIVGGELTFVSVLLRPNSLRHKGPLDPVWTAEHLARRGVDRWPGNGARRQAVAAVVVLVGAHFILF